jgi:hypothetical protein
VDIATGRITTLTGDVGRADWSGRYSGGAATGAIEGTVGYPASSVPASYVYAVEAGGSKAYRTQIQESAGQIPSFRIEGIAPGTYNVVAKPVTPLPGASPLCGGYSQFVTCGGTANCQDHSLIPVKVEASQTTKGVQVQDWYVGTTFCPLAERVP